MISLKRIVFLITLFAVLCVGCQSKSSQDPFAISTATPGSGAVTTWPSFIPQAPEEYITSAMPHCQGLTDLRTTLVFDWPDIDEALEKLEEYNWGYFTCDITQPTLQTFLHDNMPKPPYLWREVNHANHNNGQVTLYYQPYSVIFMYIWTLPKPNTQTSYMIIARGDPGIPQTWECRQWSPSFNGVAFLDTSMRDRSP